MRYPMTVALTALLAVPTLAQAEIVQTQATPAQTPQTQAAGTVQNVMVVGTSELLANFLQATISVQAGAPLSSVNLRQVEQEVIASGYFKSAVAELRSIAGQDVLYITVVPNPTIGAVEATGLTFLSADAFKKSIAELLNVAPGATLNNQRIEQAKEGLATNYQTEGYPFAPSISTTQKANADGSVTVTFVVDESAPISQVKVEGVTLLPTATVTNIFKPVYDAKKFNPELYYQAVQRLQAAYDEAGILQAGVDTRASTLEKGVLTVRVIEGKVSAVDLSALDNPQANLQTRVGQTVNLARLKEDVRTLANQTGKPVGFAIQPDPANPAQVTVFFGAADVQSGPVKSINMAGNTLVSTNTLLAAVKTKVGDIYTPQLAQEDFMQLRDVYRKAGYEISTRDAITFTEGVLTFNIREVKLVGYELQWQGNHRTKDRVITRELPATGKAFNANDIQAALGRISRLGYVKILNANVRSDPQNPENITYVLSLSEGSTSLGQGISLGLTYDSLAGGWGGEAGYSNPNIFGLGHNFDFKFGAQQNDAGQRLVGNASYTIPWLDMDFLDFRKTPTSLSFGVGSGVTGNNALLDPAKTTASTCTTGGTASTNVQVTCREYTSRTTGVSVGVGRALGKNLSGSFSVGLNYKQYYLEPLATNATSTYSDAAATALLPKENLTTRVGGGLGYDSSNSPDFPTSGVRANLNAGYNFGKEGTTPLGWTDAATGASSYYGFGNTLQKNDGSTNKQQVFAVRVNGGTLFGAAPSGSGYYIGGGSTPDPAKQLRGVADGSLFGTNYVTASAEYRYDFGLKGSSFAQGLYGVLFADAGSAWGTTANPNFALNYGFGAGVQLNLGIGGALLPSLRFDYGYSPQTNSGKFYFRLGNFW